jgi:signal transduction histidine kinase
MASLVQKTLSLVRPLADKRQLTLDFHAVPLLPKPTIDEEQIQQVLLNLLVNAIQASDRPGKVMVQISVAHTSAPADLGGRDDDYLCLSVADQGVGIPTEILPRIFEPFFSTKGVGEGTGLGLSVAYGIVREHGGWIDVQSVPRGGSRFSIYLPCSVIE